MDSARKFTPAASVDDALRDAFRRIESQPIPAAIEALIDELSGDPDNAAESPS